MQSIADAPQTDPFADYLLEDDRAGSENISLYQALTAIDAAASDSRITGICLHTNGGGTISMAGLEELRAAIETFKQSGKFVVAYSEAYGQGGYYLDRLPTASTWSPTAG